MYPVWAAITRSTLWHSRCVFGGHTDRQDVLDDHFVLPGLTLANTSRRAQEDLLGPQLDHAPRKW